MGYGIEDVEVERDAALATVERLEAENRALREVADARLALLQHRDDAQDQWVQVLERELAVYVDVGKLRQRIDSPSELRQMFAPADTPPRG